MSSRPLKFGFPKHRPGEGRPQAETLPGPGHRPLPESPESKQVEHLRLLIYSSNQERILPGGGERVKKLPFSRHPGENRGPVPPSAGLKA